VPAPAGEIDILLFPRGSEVLWSTRESAEGALATLLELVNSAQWNAFLASGAVSEQSALTNLSKALIILEGGEEVSSRRGEPLPKTGALSYFDHALGEVEHVRIWTDTLDGANWNRDRDRALQCLRNARRHTLVATDLLRETLGEPLRKTLGEPLWKTLGEPGTGSPLQQASKVRYLLYLAKAGKDEDGNGAVDWSECGIFKAGDALHGIGD